MLPKGTVLFGSILHSFVAVLLIADAAGVREVSYIGANAYDAADGFHGKHQAGVRKLYSTGILFGKQAEQCRLGRYMPATVARAEAVSTFVA